MVKAYVDPYGRTLFTCMECPRRVWFRIDPYVNITVVPGDETVSHAAFGKAISMLEGVKPEITEDDKTWLQEIGATIGQ